MKKLIFVLVGTLVFSAAGVAFAAVGNPEVQAADASFVLGATAPPTTSMCMDEDTLAMTIEQIVGTWKGTSTDGDPAGTHDWSLSSPTGVTGVTITAKFIVDTTT